MISLCEICNTNTCGCNPSQDKLVEIKLKLGAHEFFSFAMTEATANQFCDDFAHLNLDIAIVPL